MKNNYFGLAFSPALVMVHTFWFDLFLVSTF